MGWVVLELVAAVFFPLADFSPPQATKSSSERMLLSVYPIFIRVGVGLKSMTFTCRNESLAQRFHCDKTQKPASADQITANEPDKTLPTPS